MTPENLLEKIDAAFVPPQDNLTAFLPEESLKYDQLAALATNMRNEPKMAQLEMNAALRQLPSSSQRSWSSERDMSPRETKVFEALYGVEVEKSTDGVKVLPGLDVLQEMKDQLEKAKNDDAKDASHREDSSVHC